MRRRRRRRSRPARWRGHAGARPGRLDREIWSWRRRRSGGRDSSRPPGQSQEARYWEPSRCFGSGGPPSTGRLRRRAGERRRLAVAPEASTRWRRSISIRSGRGRRHPAPGAPRGLARLAPRAEATFTLGRTLVELARTGGDAATRAVRDAVSQARAEGGRPLSARTRAARGRRRDGGGRRPPRLRGGEPDHELARRRGGRSSRRCSNGRQARARRGVPDARAARPETPEGLYEPGVAAALGQETRRDAAWSRLRQKFLATSSPGGGARPSPGRSRAEAVRRGLTLSRTASASDDPESRARAALVAGEAELASSTRRPRSRPSRRWPVPARARGPLTRARRRRSPTSSSASGGGPPTLPGVLAASQTASSASGPGSGPGVKAGGQRRRRGR